MEADLATGDEWDTWREECEERDIVSRLGASLLALAGSSLDSFPSSSWWTLTSGGKGLSEELFLTLFGEEIERSFSSLSRLGDLGRVRCGLLGGVGVL